MALAVAMAPNSSTRKVSRRVSRWIGAGAGGEQLEVGAPGIAERDERRRQRAGGRARLVLEQRLLVRGVLDVLADVPRAAMLGDLLGLEEDRDEVVVGAHDDLLRGEPPRDRVAVAVEGDAEHLGHAHALDVVGIEGGRGERLEPSLLLVLEDELRGPCRSPRARARWRSRRATRRPGR